MNKKLSIFDITTIALCAAIMVAAQSAMRPLANIEPVSLLIIVFTQVFKKKTIFIIYVFVLIEGLIYGFHLWWICYLYVWLVLYFVVKILGDTDNPFVLAVVAALFGLCFGALCSLVYLFTAGIGGAISWFVSGILFDLMHCVGNFFIVLLLYKPIKAVMLKALALRPAQ